MKPGATSQTNTNNKHAARIAACFFIVYIVLFENCITPGFGEMKRKKGKNGDFNLILNIDIPL